jgi:ATF/CREB family transcription factor
MMNNPQTPSSALANAAATITPNTLNAITGVLANHNSSNPTSSSPPHPLSVSHLPSNGNGNTSSQYPPNNNAYPSQAANVASTAANGLFLLSQAHQELTKREAQARSNNNIPVVSTSPSLPSQQQVQQSHLLKRGTKRKSTADSVSPDSPSLPTMKGKRSRADTTSSVATITMRETTSPDADEQEEEEEDDEIEELPLKKSGHKGAVTTNGAGGRSKVPMTEEEKRKNFLERNRQAALKCRQRKKAWLAQLQAKVEYLENENERLTNALVSSREEISRLSAIVGASGVSTSVSNPPLPSTSVVVSATGTAPNAPSTTGGRGYGY